MGQRLKRVHDEMSKVMEEAGEDPIHDLRVAIRRASQSLRLFGELLPQKEGRRMRRALKPALDAAGAARDLDVGADLLRKEGLKAEHPLFAVMAAERQRAALKLIGRIYLLRAEDVPLLWLPVVDRLQPAPRPAPEEARAVLPPLCGEFFAAGRKTMAKSPTPEKLHALRLAAKRFRYTLELWEPFYGPAFRVKLESVRQIQSILGKRQDCAVMELRLAPLRAIDMELDESYKKVEARAARLEREFHDYWHAKFDAAGEQERWMRYLARRLPVRRTAL
jgi:CHAD domain-containing protein